MRALAPLCLAVFCLNLQEKKQKTKKLHWQTLRDALEEQGAYFDRVAVKKHGALRGLYADRDYDAGAKIIGIPRSVMISEATADEQSPLWKRNLPVSDHSIFAMAMLERREKEPIVRAWWNLLPANFSYMPYFWSAEDRERLQGSRLHTDLSLDGEFMDDYATICEKDKSYERFKLEEFIHMRLALQTRMFNTGAKSIGTVIPFLDLVNLGEEVNAFVDLNDTEYGAVLRASHNILIGEEITITYHQLENYMLLLQYGFILEGGSLPEGAVPPDYLRFSFDWPDSPEKGNFLESLHLYPDLKVLGTFQTMIHDTMPYARIMALEDDEVASMRHRAKKGHVGPFSVENEKLALKKLIDVFTLKRDSYAQSAADDDVDLKTAEKGSIERSILLVTRREKRLCSIFIRFASKALDCISGPLDRAEAAATAVVGGAHGWPEDDKLAFTDYVGKIAKSFGAHRKMI